MLTHHSELPDKIRLGRLKTRAALTFVHARTLRNGCGLEEPAIRDRALAYRGGATVCRFSPVPESARCYAALGSGRSVSPPTEVVIEIHYPHLTGSVLVLLLSAGTASAQELPKHVDVTIEYPEDTRPGLRAEVFAPGVVSNGEAHSRLAIAPDGREMCWARFSERSGRRFSQLACISRSGGRWTDPYTPASADGGMSANPMFSPDGTRLYFSFRPESEEAWSIRYAERRESGWSSRKSDGFLLNPTSSFTRSGRVYFCDSMAGKPWNRGIYRARLTADGYEDATALPPVINSPYIDYTPYVAPDESFLMLSSSRPSAEERMFIVISFRKPDGTWSEPRRMHDALGYPGNARFPSISPDGKYLFFCGDDRNFYWVDIAAVDKELILLSPPADSVFAVYGFLQQPSLFGGYILGSFGLAHRPATETQLDRALKDLPGRLGEGNRYLLGIGDTHVVHL